MNLFQIIILLIITAILSSQKHELEWSEEFTGPHLIPEIWNCEKGFSKNKTRVLEVKWAGEIEGCIFSGPLLCGSGGFL